MISNDAQKRALDMMGSNEDGQLGIEHIEQKYSSMDLYLDPVKVMDDVASFSNHCSSLYTECAAVKTDGTLWVWGCWGFTDRGTTAESRKPHQIADNVSYACCTNYGVAVIRPDHSLWALTDGTGVPNETGYIGNGTHDYFYDTEYKTMDPCSRANTVEYLYRYIGR